MKLEYKVGGRRVSAQEFSREINKQVGREVEDAIALHARAIRCPGHNAAPGNIRRNSSGIHFTTCCDALREAVARSFE